VDQRVLVREGQQSGVQPGGVGRVSRTHRRAQRRAREARSTGIALPDLVADLDLAHPADPTDAAGRQRIGTVAPDHLE
jgi:hypothetical protein